MISTKCASNLNEIPENWVYEYYLGLTGMLNNKNLVLKSPFTTEKNPSFYLRYVPKTGNYIFKDFSSGFGGNRFEFAKVFLERKLGKKLTNHDVSKILLRDYTKFLREGNIITKAPNINYSANVELHDYKVRRWNVCDKNYWTSYGISSYKLNKFNVEPLSEIRWKFDDESILTAREAAAYGYFNDDGSLYKIYRPLNKTHRFSTINSQMQGIDNLKMNVPVLVLCSSLKDVMVFDTMNFKNAESTAPDSETIDVPKHFVALFKSRYDKIYSLYDDDDTGIKNMKKLKEEDNIDYIHLQGLSKDLSDSVRDYNKDLVREKIINIIKSIKNE